MLLQGGRGGIPGGMGGGMGYWSCQGVFGWEGLESKLVLGSVQRAGGYLNS